MKIAFIPSTFLPHIGGAEIQAHNVANKLVERGHDVEIFVLDKGKLIAEGTHAELLENSSIYKNFYDKQIRKD